MFVKIIRKTSIITVLLLAVSALMGWALLTWPEAAATGISRGLSVCASIIIPSLFPFMVLAGFLVKSGVNGAIGRRLERPVRFIFGLPGCCAAGILLSMLGGFPAGAIAVGGLVRQGEITPAQGRRMLCFCVNGGPAFIISAVGSGMLGNTAQGIMLYAAHIAASLIIGIVCGSGIPQEERCPPPKAPGRPAHPGAKGNVMSAFVESVADACRSMLTMCGFILLFAAVLSLMDGSGLSRHAYAVLLSLTRGNTALAEMLSCIVPGMLEVSCGSIAASSPAAGEAAPLLLGAFLGWGGLSVQCQISAALHDLRLIDRRFFAARGAHALLGGVLSLLLFRYIPADIIAIANGDAGTGVTVPVFSSFIPGRSEGVFVPFAASAAASAALLFMCGLFLLSLPGKEK